MDLTSRFIEEKDFPACLELLRGRLAYPSDLMADLPRAWQALLKDNALNAAVLEIPGPGKSTVISGFGLSVVVTDTWMTASRSSQEPYLTARTIRRELDGPTPILRPPAILRANGADGVNVLILHYGETRERLAGDALAAVRYRMFEAFIDMHRGYRIKDVVQEFWDEIDPEFVINGWGTVLTDYSPFFRQRGQMLPPLGRRPHLIGITRAEVLANPGKLASPVFVHTPPRLSFTLSEKRMIRYALAGRTDVELARGLGLALPTIKSRWRGIYDHVGQLAPEIVVDSPSCHTGVASRGQEKRRRLLEYVRRHPEELSVVTSPRRYARSDTALPAPGRSPSV